MVDSVKKATNTSIQAAYIVWYMIITILYIFVLTPRLVGEMQSSKDEEKKWEESTSHSCCLEGWKENRKEWANKRHNFTSFKVRRKLKIHTRFSRGHLSLLQSAQFERILVGQGRLPPAPSPSPSIFSF